MSRQFEYIYFYINFGLPKMSGKRIEDQGYFLPCPFCGDCELEIIESEFEDDQDDEALTVYCDCGAQGPAARTEDEATLKWNSRFKS